MIGFAHPGLVRLVHQNHQVDIGAGVQLAAAEAAHRDQCDAVVHRKMVRAPGFGKKRVDERGALVNQIGCRHACLELFGQRSARRGQGLAVGRHRQAFIG